MTPVPDTISQGLGRYSIGEKLRTLRLKKGMGLVELSKYTGLSAALLSKLERGKLFPTLPTLLRIALVHSVGLEYFFSDERTHRVVSVVPTEKVRPHQHPGVELLYVLKGSLTIRIGSEEFQLGAEDAIYFDSAVQHSYRRHGQKQCTGVIVTVP